MHKLCANYALNKCIKKKFQSGLRPKKAFVLQQNAAIYSYIVFVCNAIRILKPEIERRYGPAPICSCCLTHMPTN